MNRFILKHAYPVTFVILAILAWFIYRQFIVARSPLFPFVAVVAVVWALGTLVFIYFWPSITYRAFKRAILQHGPGGPIPVNTLYAAPNLPSPSASSSSLFATGTDYLLYFVGVLDLSTGPQVLRVPDFAARYYSMQFTDPSDGDNFAYVGKRATGTQAGDFLITGPGWQGSVSQGMKQISSPHHSVLVMGRALVESESDVATVYALTKQIQLTPLSQWQPSR
ncbi:MAG TPA: DUF1254 domain-containing protein [Anaerolinea sp.]|nr:DUF1254 domain-containing protein [Anaerolinea sp.]